MNRSHENAASLLERARGDRQAFHVLIADPTMPAWLVAFHAQQAVEKALKAALASASVEYPRTHNLAMLIGLLRHNSLPLPPDADEIPALTPFGTASRYDDALSSDDSVTLDQAWATQCVDRTISWAQSRCSGDKSSK